MGEWRFPCGTIPPIVVVYSASVGKALLPLVIMLIRATFFPLRIGDGSVTSTGLKAGAEYAADGFSRSMKAN